MEPGSSGRTWIAWVTSDRTRTRRTNEAPETWRLGEVGEVLTSLQARRAWPTAPGGPRLRLPMRTATTAWRHLALHLADAAQSPETLKSTSRLPGSGRKSSIPSTPSAAAARTTAASAVCRCRLGVPQGTLPVQEQARLRSSTRRARGYGRAPSGLGSVCCGLSRPTAAPLCVSPVEVWCRPSSRCCGLALQGMTKSRRRHPRRHRGGPPAPAATAARLRSGGRPDGSASRAGSAPAAPAGRAASSGTLAASAIGGGLPGRPSLERHPGRPERTVGSPAKSPRSPRRARMTETAASGGPTGMVRRPTAHAAPVPRVAGPVPAGAPNRASQQRVPWTTRARVGPTSAWPNFGKSCRRSTSSSIRRSVPNSGLCSASCTRTSSPQSCECTPSRCFTSFRRSGRCAKLKKRRRPRKNRLRHEALPWWPDRTRSETSNSDGGATGGRCRGPFPPRALFLCIPSNSAG
mmetsp:Transcript_79552/g.208920  ORF Transcript_79552/g.208920 Transcript_79552/m.208920 type:complete len:463 (-) Transcript_79552:38-1426(-)